MKKIIQIIACLFLAIATMVNPFSVKAFGRGYKVHVKITHDEKLIYDSVTDRGSIVKIDMDDEGYEIYAEFVEYYDEIVFEDFQRSFSGYPSYLEAEFIEKKVENGVLKARYHLRAIKKGAFTYSADNDTSIYFTTTDPWVKVSLEDAEKTYCETDREIYLTVGKGYYGSLEWYVEDRIDEILANFNETNILHASWPEQSSAYFSRVYGIRNILVVPLEEGECNVDLCDGNTWHIVAKASPRVQITKLEVTDSNGYFTDMTSDKLILTEGARYSIHLEGNGEFEKYYSMEDQHSHYSVLNALKNGLSFATNYVVTEYSYENGNLSLTMEFTAEEKGYYGFQRIFEYQWLDVSIHEVGCDPTDLYAYRYFGFCDINFIGRFWYENGKRQGVYGDHKNIIDTLYNLERGREIFDPERNGWYWLDAVYDGKAAYGKEVWMPYVYQNEDQMPEEEMRMNANMADEGMKEYTYQCMKNKTGKWVRYDPDGHMMKGWVTISGSILYNLEIYFPNQSGNTYYYDTKTGLMAKGDIMIEGKMYHFDEITGVLQK